MKIPFWVGVGGFPNRSVLCTGVNLEDPLFTVGEVYEVNSIGRISHKGLSLRGGSAEWELVPLPPVNLDDYL